MLCLSSGGELSTDGSVVQVLSASRKHLTASLHCGSGRSPADFVSHLQLAWELEELLNNNNSEDGGGGFGGGGGRPRQLQAALHEMWLSWHVGVWEGSAGLPPPPGAMGAGAAEALCAAPARIYLVG